jgi:translation elongation factor EF-4
MKLLLLQVGYVIPGIKDVKAARVGDTWHLARQPVTPLPGFKPIKPMVFAGEHIASSYTTDYACLPRPSSLEVRLYGWVRRVCVWVTPGTWQGSQ